MRVGTYVEGLRWELGGDGGDDLWIQLTVRALNSPGTPAREESSRPKRPKPVGSSPISIACGASGPKIILSFRWPLHSTVTGLGCKLAGLGDLVWLTVNYPIRLCVWMVLAELGFLLLYG